MLQATTGTSPSATTVSYVPGVAQHDSLKPTEAAKWGYTLSDAQNSRLLVDGAGMLAHRWEWEPFGRSRADTTVHDTDLDPPHPWPIRGRGTRFGSGRQFVTRRVGQ